MLTYRVLQPCKFCESTRPICTKTNAACRSALEAVERQAVVDGERTPDGEVVFACLNFRAARRAAKA